MMEDMLADEEVRIQYSAKYYESSNYWKYSIGQMEGLTRLDVAGERRRDEAAFMEWVRADSSRMGEYGTALKMIREAVESREAYQRGILYLFECIYYGMESVSAAMDFVQLGGVLNSPDPDQVEIDYLVGNIRESMADFYRDYHRPTDKKIMEAMLKLLLEDLEPELLPGFVTEIETEYRGNINRYLEKYFKRSIFPDETKMSEFLEYPDAKVLNRDPAFKAMISFLGKYYELLDLSARHDDWFQRGSRLYMKGKMDMHPDKAYYPDANRSIRLSYGSAGDYQPRDAVFYNYYTTLRGIMEKEDPENPEFTVPDKLKMLYQKKDYGPYGNDGEMKVCFITNNDITGGNSGSPVINGKGELIGLAFDGNWEAMSGDVEFVEGVQKCINVDIRYVLFIIDKFAGAGHLVEEMKLIWPGDPESLKEHDRNESQPEERM
jgi:hypothetical protein